MQDSLEDFIKISKNVKQDDSLKISKEMVVTAQLKKECDTRAMKIVEFSIDGKLRPEVFTRCLPFINQLHYQDIVEERAITKLCGYSICGKRIPDMPKKQYFISTKSNRVYDITERKNFCSNFCYKASLHIKKQIDNSPLWLRKLEDIPEYKLLHFSEGGLPGEYIDQGIIKPVEVPKFTSIASFSEASLGDLVHREFKQERSKNVKATNYKKPSRLKSTMQTIKENEVEEEAQVSPNEAEHLIKHESKSNSTFKKDNHHKKNCIASLPSIEELEFEEKLTQNKDTDNGVVKENGKVLRIKSEITQSLLEASQKSVECSDIKIENATSNSENLDRNTEQLSVRQNVERTPANRNKKSAKKKANANKQKLDIEIIIKKSLEDWLTLESCIFIHGEQKVKQVLNEEKLSDYFEELNVLQLRREQQMKYMEICRRLQFQEMADEKFDKAMTGNEKLKPLPDYKKLKDDTRDLNLKVKAFYQGGMYVKDDTNFPTQINKSMKEENVVEEPPAVLPPVDSNSQNLLRRKIFLTSINIAMQKLLQALGVSYFSSVLSDVQALVKTFNLRADNITYKPVIWNYIALVLLHLLSFKDDTIKQMLEEKKSQDYISMVLGSLPNRKSFLNDTTDSVRHMDKFVGQYITKGEVNM